MRPPVTTLQGLGYFSKDRLSDHLQTALEPISELGVTFRTVSSNIAIFRMGLSLAGGWISTRGQSEVPAQIFEFTDGRLHRTIRVIKRRNAMDFLFEPYRLGMCQKVLETPNRDL